MAITCTCIYQKMMCYITWGVEDYYKSLLQESFRIVHKYHCLDFLLRSSSIVTFIKTYVSFFLLQLLIVIASCGISGFLESALKKKQILLVYNQRIDAQQSLYAAEYGDMTFQLSVPLSFCKYLFIVSVGTLCVGNMPTVSQKAGAFGEMTAFSELNYLINSFITRLFEKAIPSVQWSKSCLRAKQCLLNPLHPFYLVDAVSLEATGKLLDSKLEVRRSGFLF